MAELAYAADLKSADLTVLRVRVPSSVLFINSGGETTMDTRKENEERKTNEMLIIVHSKRLVDFLIGLGLKSGNKMSLEKERTQAIKNK